MTFEDINFAELDSLSTRENLRNFEFEVTGPWGRLWAGPVGKSRAFCAELADGSTVEVRFSDLAKARIATGAEVEDLHRRFQEVSSLAESIRAGFQLAAEPKKVPLAGRLMCWLVECMPLWRQDDRECSSCFVLAASLLRVTGLAAQSRDLKDGDGILKRDPAAL